MIGFIRIVSGVLLILWSVPHAIFFLIDIFNGGNALVGHVVIWSFFGIPLLLVYYVCKNKLAGKGVPNTTKQPSAVEKQEKSEVKTALEGKESFYIAKAEKTFEFLTDGTDYSNHKDEIETIEYGDPVFVVATKTRAGRPTLELRSDRGRRFGYIPFKFQDQIFEVISENKELFYTAIVSDRQNSKPKIRLEYYESEGRPDNSHSIDYIPEKKGCALVVLLIMSTPFAVPLVSNFYS